MLSQPLEANKDILGYTLKERIGAGGFGEVWSAVAPGGLMKALKIVYGFHDEKRAQAELKALDRVKNLRHPFLLSLERIEIFESQLVVVTELADNSLADVYNEYAAKGEPGIPREKLVTYIRSAADALDYMSEEHKLQHLDIKPENLLMVSGHVKVADFGLIKDLQDASQSLMSGMTPAYAAPELFDGRPGLKSDQYSLAIVYQEMLTGDRPFPGQTPAQLAAQHMHGKPNLRPLPKSDQQVIAKALSKDPSVRFKSCRDMAEELGNKKRAVRKAVRRTPTARSDADTESRAFSGASRDVTAVLSKEGLPFQTSEIEHLDPPLCDGKSAVIRPVLVVGVGSTANQLIAKLKSAWTLRHGAIENAPAIKLLCIDADRDALHQFRMARSEDSLLSDELLEVPLRKAEDYRRSSDRHLSWLSRRWIYNIPRSLQTEGLRPLGRLAFADHFDAICERLQEGIKQISTEENLAKTADLFDLEPGGINPRVFVLTSIAGGIGSGMALDLAYTIKLLLNESGLASDSVTGVLLNSNYQRNRDPGLSAANAFAFMTEMRHFVEHGFPGDVSIGLPEFEDEPPFDFTYFNELGNDLSQSDHDKRLEEIAEYIYLSSTSKCSEFFDACRSLETEIEHLSLRTFGLSQSSQTCAGLTNQVGRGLVRHWIQGDLDYELIGFEKAEKLFAEHELTQDSVLELINSQAISILEGSFEPIISGASDIVSSSRHDCLANLCAYLDGAFGCAPKRRDSTYVDLEVCFQMEELVGNLGHEIGDKLSSQILQLLDGKTMRLREALEVSRACSKLITALEEQLVRANQQCDQETNNQLQSIQLILKNGGPPEELNASLAEYCHQRLMEFVMRYSKNYYRAISQAARSMEDLLNRFVVQVSNLKDEFESEDEISTADDEDLDTLITESVAEQIQEHIGKSEIQVYESIAHERGGFLKMLNEHSIWNQTLAKEIRGSVQLVLGDAFKKISLESVIEKAGVGPEQLLKWLNGKISEARPILDSCGGKSRLLIGLPALSTNSVLPTILQNQFNLIGRPISGTSGNFVLCFEAEDVSFANVAFRLLEARPDAIELVKRIHTRKDVDWTTLDDLL